MKSSNSPQILSLKCCKFGEKLVSPEGLIEQRPQGISLCSAPKGQMNVCVPQMHVWKPNPLCDRWCEKVGPWG